MPAAKIIAFSLFVPRGAKFALLVERAARFMDAAAFVVRICYKSAIGARRELLIATLEDAGDELVTSISSIIALIRA